MNQRSFPSLFLLLLLSTSVRAGTPDEATLLTVAVSPDGRTLAAGYATGVIRLWSLPGGDEGQALYHRGGLAALSFSPDGKQLASLGGDRSVRVWDWADRKLLQKFAEEGGFTCLTFTGDGKLLAAAGKEVVLWNPSTGKEVSRWADTGGETLALASSPDGRTLASASGEGTVQIRDVAEGKLIHELEQDAGVCCLAVAPDGSLLATGDNSGKIRLWDLASGQQKKELRLKQSCLSLAFGADGKFLAAGSGCAIVRFEVASGKEGKAWPGFRNALAPITFDAGSRALAATTDPLAAMWNLASPDRPRRTTTLKLGSSELREAWDELAADDPGRALDAEYALSLDPEGATTFLKERIGPEPPVPAAADLIAALDHTDFAKRQSAMDQLHRLGREALPELRKALEAGPALDVRQRLDQLVDWIEKQTLPSDYRRNLRAVSLLARTGTPEAHRLLEEVARGAAHSPATRKARELLRDPDGAGKQP